MILATIGWLLLAQRLFHALKPFEDIATNLGKNWVLDSAQVLADTIFMGILAGVADMKPVFLGL